MEQIRFLSLKEVQRLTGNLSRSTIWRWQQQGLFPRSIHSLRPNRPQLPLSLGKRKRPQIEPTT